jgi:hypothetical protein
VPFLVGCQIFDSRVENLFEKLVEELELELDPDRAPNTVEWWTSKSPILLRLGSFHMLYALLNTSQRKLSRSLFIYSFFCSQNIWAVPIQQTIVSKLEKNN